MHQQERELSLEKDRYERERADYEARKHTMTADERATAEARLAGIRPHAPYVAMRLCYQSYLVYVPPSMFSPLLLGI